MGFRGYLVRVLWVELAPAMERRERSRSRRDQDKASVVLVHRGCRLQLEAPRDAGRDHVDVGLQHLASFYGVVVEAWRLAGGLMAQA